MASSTFTQRLVVGIMICTLIVDLITLTAARPQDGDAASVAAAIRYLQELETKHAQHARPRFGKRGNYLNPTLFGQDEQEADWQDPTFSR
ncbi:neuropeptide F-like isoform X1 [Anopheles darlingi]|uniref:neuropeptide F-like isoform X1 n=1 Tax=Anopheles darlingi TaxID=43151 RepID=UPI0020FFFA04|nr:neuropeptide F-like isoform X1 [Anopheles darlingi]